MPDGDRFRKNVVTGVLDMAVIHRFETTDGFHEDTLTPVTAIYQKCLFCSDGSADDAYLCPIVDCALWPYRTGENPSRKRITQSEHT